MQDWRRRDRAGLDLKLLRVRNVRARPEQELASGIDVRRALNDGELASTDCNDNNPAIRHGIVDIPDDGIDQNCDAVNLDRDGDGENRP